jgi:hypothetical protein
LFGQFRGTVGRWDNEPSGYVNSANYSVATQLVASQDEFSSMKLAATIKIL